MIRKNIKKEIVAIFLWIFPTISFAADYTLLAPLKESSTKVTNPMAYITDIYWYVLGLTIAVSVLMMILGGLEYTLTWASESKKGEAKARITNAITGLVIALTAYLLLYTINPNLVTFKMGEAGSVCNKTTGAPATTGSNEIPISGNANGGGGTIVGPETVGSEGQLPAGTQLDPNTGQILYE